MKKIPTLFLRDDDDSSKVSNEVTPGCEWVLRGEGVPLRMYDGICVMKDKDDQWWARRTVKLSQRVPLHDFVEVERDDVTGIRVGWMPLDESFSQWKAFEEAREASPTLYVGTYELCGPTINGNPERLSWAGLVFHNHAQNLTRLFEIGMYPGSPYPFDFLRRVLTADDFPFEGVVWHHPDGRMAKLKKKDFAAPSSGKCPTCSAPEPRVHPATQSEGEVSFLCPDSYHTPA